MRLVYYFEIKFGNKTTFRFNKEIKMLKTKINSLNYPSSSWWFVELLSTALYGNTRSATRRWPWATPSIWLWTRRWTFSSHRHAPVRLRWPWTCPPSTTSLRSLGANASTPLLGPKIHENFCENRKKFFRLASNFPTLLTSVPNYGE